MQPWPPRIPIVHPAIQAQLYGGTHSLHLVTRIREREGVETRDSSRATIQWSRLELLHWSYKTI
jgi:hypothetical protein